MKTKRLLILLTAGLSLGLSAQNIYQSDIESWSGAPLNPSLDWMGSKTNLAADSVQQNSTSPYHGNFCAKLINSTTTAKRFTTQPQSIVPGKAYLVSFSARGKGSIRAGLYDGTNYLYANYESVSGTTWHRFKQSLLSAATSSAAEFILAVKSTVAANGHIDVDSVTIEQYTPPTGLSLYQIEYTTAPSGNSPYYGEIIQNFGGIVTASNSTGYYLQTTGSTAWSGVFVYDPTNAPSCALGDSILITGMVDEYFSMTEIENVSSWSKVSSGHPVPAPVTLTTNAINSEMYEAVLVTSDCSPCTSFTVAYGQGAINDGSGATQVDKQLYPYTYVVGTAYVVTGPVNYNFGNNIEPRSAADITVCTVGIDEVQNNFGASVYPNPYTNSLTVKIPFNAEKLKATVVDVLGKEFVTKASSGSEISLHEINLPAGIYMVKIVADGKTQMVRIIKE